MEVLRLVFVGWNWVNIDVNDAKKCTDIHTSRSRFFAKLAQGCIRNTRIRVFHMPAGLQPAANLFVPQNDHRSIRYMYCKTARGDMPLGGIA